MVVKMDVKMDFLKADVLHLDVMKVGQMDVL